MELNPPRARSETWFLGSALGSLALVLAWLVVRPQVLVGSWYSTELLALTHGVTLAFATSFLFGALLRLAPALQIAPRHPRLVGWQCFLHLLGTTGMVFHRQYFELLREYSVNQRIGMAWSGLLVLAAAGLMTWNLRGLVARARAGDWPSRWILGALVHLMVAGGLGIASAFLRLDPWGTPLMRAPVAERFAVHLHLGGVGWIAGAVFGLEVLMRPRQAVAARWMTARFLLHHVGLLGPVLCLLTGLPGAQLFAGVLALSLALRSVPLLLRARSVHATLAERLGHAVLLLGIGLGLSIASGALPPDGEIRDRIVLAYGFVVLLGWVVLAIAGPLAAMAIGPRRRLELAGLLAFGGTLGATFSIVNAAEMALRVSLVVMFVSVLLLTLHFLVPRRGGGVPTT